MIKLAPVGASYMAAAQRKRILLVEDHADTLVMTAMVLRRHGYDVTTAKTKSEAVELCTHEQFDLLVGDLQLPDGTGWEMMEEIAKVCKLKSIAYTGYGYDSDIEHSRASGFTVHLTKPAELDVLLSTIGQLLAEQR
jgi:two-component system, chemotaxis family, CheB/CheR fusion protein